MTWFTRNKELPNDESSRFFIVGFLCLIIGLFAYSISTNKFLDTPSLKPIGIMCLIVAPYFLLMNQLIKLNKWIKGIIEIFMYLIVIILFGYFVYIQFF